MRNTYIPFICLISFLSIVFYAQQKSVFSEQSYTYEFKSQTVQHSNDEPNDGSLPWEDENKSSEETSSEQTLEDVLDIDLVKYVFYLNYKRFYVFQTQQPASEFHRLLERPPRC